MAQFVFPKVEPVDIQRSRRDLSLYKGFDAQVGSLIPVLNLEMLPDDWMRINTIATVQSMPMVAPVRGRWKVSFDYYYNPWSNIYGYMDNNRKLSTEQHINQCRYVMPLGYQGSESFVRTTYFSSLLSVLPKVPNGGVLDFLGCPIGYFGEVTKDSNGQFVGKPTYHPAEGLITYLDIVRNYYVNNQEATIPYQVAANGVFYGVTDDEVPYWYSELSLSSLDDFFDNVRYYSRNGFVSPKNIREISPIAEYYSRAMGVPLASADTDERFDIKRNCGLFLRTYRMDLLRGIMNSSVGSVVASASVQSDTSGDFVNMSDVLFANKFFALVNRLDLSGGRWSDTIFARWNVNPGIEVDRPLYLGSHSMWLNTIDVVATASGVSDVADNRNKNSTLGQQVGYQVGKMTVGQGRDRQRPITIKSKQYGTLMCIFSIVPDVVYSQGFELNMMKTKFTDIYEPAFKQIGYQDVLRGEFDAFPTFIYESEQFPTCQFDDNVLTEVVGKRVAWSEYMASLNRVHGDFAFGQPLDYWFNNRVFTYTGQIEGSSIDGEASESMQTLWQSSSLKNLLYDFDPTTYVYPHLWNNPFANTSVDARNYIVDVFFQIDANRSLGKRLMPHL